MHKDFEKWHKYKKNIDSHISLKNIHQREVWWCCLGVNIGSEQNGVGDNFERLILILKTYSKNTFLGLPITSKNRVEIFQFEINLSKTYGYVLLDQARVLDKKRLNRLVEVVPLNIFIEIIKSFKDII